MEASTGTATAAAKTQPLRGQWVFVPENEETESRMAANATPGTGGLQFHFNPGPMDHGYSHSQKKTNGDKKSSSDSDLTSDSDSDSDSLSDDSDLNGDFRDQIRNQNDQIKEHCKQLKAQHRQMKHQMKQQFLQHGHDRGFLNQPHYFVPPVPLMHPMPPTPPTPPMPPAPPLEFKKPFVFRFGNGSFKFPVPPTSSTGIPFMFGFPSLPPPFDALPPKHQEALEQGSQVDRTAESDEGWVCRETRKDGNVVYTFFKKQE
ncbi:hypothetical protein BJ741DRAFT_608830 [Chytriomyces cf. hyalinus JEL632]|nr:hypothetical protein BJ741DRAFT_608830 [Chytriomyces cf. hyalinus JEL632]